MDWKYILKRVITGVLIFIAIYFLKNYIFLEVHADTYPATTSCILQNTQGGAESCKTPPNTFNVVTNGGLGFNVWFNPVSLQNGHTYYMKFLFHIEGANQDGPANSLQFLVGNSGTAGSSATPDRNEQKHFVKLSPNTYELMWSFHLDVSGNFDTVRATFFIPMTPGTIGGVSYLSGGLQDATLEIVDLTPSSSSGANQDIINNNYSDTQNIINNNNSNTQNIINNDNSNTESVIESQNVCQNIDSTVAKNGGYLNASGVLTGNAGSGLRVSNFISINKSTKIKVLQNHTTTARTCFYDDTQTVISCITANSMTTSQFLTIPSNAKYVRFTINYVDNRPQFEVCNNGNQAINDSINNLNDSLNDDNTSKEQSDFQDFFDDFNYGDDTLTSVVTAPLRFINSLTDTCSPVTLNVLGQNVVLPCGDIIFWNRNDVSSFRTFWNLLFGGAIIYALALKLYKVIHNAFDPDKDNIETFEVV